MAKRPATRPRGTRPANPRRPARPPQRTSPEAHAVKARRRRWPLFVALGAAIALVTTAAGAIYLTGGASEVSVDQAVDDFRSAPEVQIGEATTAPSAGPATPRSGPAQKAAESSAASGAAAKPAAATRPQGNAFQPVDGGVYVYATSGYEETDALNGQRHTYPRETHMTIRKDGCGWTSRWQPFSERWEESEFCETPQGSRTVRYTMYHEFFQRGQTEDFDCDGYVHKKGDKPGDTWTFTCKSHNTTATSKVTVVAFETLNVGGTPVKTIHIRYDITSKGANNGKLVQDRWLTDSPRRMVRLIQKADLKTESPFGPVGYKESFRIDLKSMTPRR